MICEISYNSLKQHLLDADDETEQFKIREQLPMLSTEGGKYLYHKVLKALLDGEEVSTKSLDYENFEHSDIVDLFSFYENTFTCQSNELSKLRGIYSKCSEEMPMAHSVCFI